MPPLIAVALLGAGIYAGYRIAAGLMSAARNDADNAPGAAGDDRSEPAGGEARDLGVLERDPETGEYRPARPRA